LVTKTIVAKNKGPKTWGSKHLPHLPLLKYTLQLGADLGSLGAHQLILQSFKNVFLSRKFRPKYAYTRYVFTKAAKNRRKIFRHLRCYSHVSPTVT